MTEKTAEQKSAESRQAFIDTTDKLADKIMDMLEPEDLAASHLSLTKAVCYVLDLAAKHDKRIGVSYRNFTTQAINQMFVMKKGDEQVVR